MLRVINFSYQNNITNMHTLRRYNGLTVTQLVYRIVQEGTLHIYIYIHNTVLVETNLQSPDWPRFIISRVLSNLIFSFHGDVETTVQLYFVFVPRRDRVTQDTPFLLKQTGLFALDFQ